MLNKFLKDREAARHFSPRSNFRPQQIQTPNSETREYTAEEIEKARKEAKLPPGLKLPPQPPQVNTHDEVQRSLKTIQEINKINEMNRRLMQQQQQNR